jgi:predicted metal-dependent phosphotriesterase family hydrolase
MLTRHHLDPHRLTRREAIHLLGIAGGLGVLGSRELLSGEASPAEAAQAATDAPARAHASTEPLPRGAVVRTILEDVPPARLTGITLFHEHLSISKPNGEAIFYDDTGLIADEVKACAADGVSCIVDTGVAGLGRKIGALRTIAQRSGMFIVAGGGLHVKSDYPPDVFRKTAAQLADDFVALAKAERWGVIGEMGTGTAVSMDPEKRKAFQAAANAHVRTGLPIVTHTSDGCAHCALEQVDVLEAAGANLRQVVIGHLNNIEKDPLAAPLAIAKRGANLGFDHSGKPDDPRLDEYVRTLLALLEAGYEDRIFLSSDFASAKYLRKNGGPGIDMTVTTFVPRLRHAGVGDATLHQILVENPRRLLAFVPKAT